MKIPKVNKQLICIIVILGIGITIPILLLLPIGVDTKWKTKAAGEGWGIDISGKTELLGPDGSVLKVLSFSKAGYKLTSMTHLAFFNGVNEVKGMRTTINWDAAGTDVDWNTLDITISAGGTGAYAEQKKGTLKKGLTAFVLPVTTAQLGKTPVGGEKIRWDMTVTVEASVRDIVGRTLTAKANPVKNSFESVWADPSFQVTTSAQGDTVTGGTTSYDVIQGESVELDPNEAARKYPDYYESGGGGCGPLDHHLLWTHNVKPETTFADVYPVLFYGTVAAEILLVTAYCIHGKRR